MRKLLILILVLTLLACAGALADHGEADIVSPNGVPQHLTLVKIEFAKVPINPSSEEELAVTVVGFTDGLLTGKFGENCSATLSAVCGGEEIKSDSILDQADDEGTGIYYIPTQQMPDALLLYPYGESNPVTLWEAGDPIPEASGEAGAEANG